MPRLPVVLALALQLSGSIAPADVFILCVSNDGCVELELARPGTGRCDEIDCDDGHGTDASHACHDIPILGDAVAPARPVGTDGGGSSSVVLATVPRLERPAPLVAAPIARAAAPPAGTPRRTVVLQL